MPAPEGNQNAVGNEGGRPKEHDRLQIGRDFVKWATNNPDALTVPMFTITKGILAVMMRKWASEDVEFNSLFMQGKEHIGINRLRATLSNAETKLDSSIYRAHVGNYDSDLNSYMREEKQFDSDLKKEEAKAEISSDEQAIAAFAKAIKQQSAVKQ